MSYVLKIKGVLCFFLKELKILPYTFEPLITLKWFLYMEWYRVPISFTFHMDNFWRKWQPTPVFLPRKSHEQRSLAGYSSWDRKSQTWLTTKQQERNHSMVLTLPHFSVMPFLPVIKFLKLLESVSGLFCSSSLSVSPWTNTSLSSLLFYNEAWHLRRQIPPLLFFSLLDSVG